MTNTLEIPQDILDSAHMTTDELKVELAVALYAQGRLAIGKARELAEINAWQFQQRLASRENATDRYLFRKTPKTAPFFICVFRFPT